MTKARDLANFNVSGVLTSTSNLNASKLTSGTIPNDRYGTPTFNGSNLTGIAGGENTPSFKVTTSSGTSVANDSNVKIAFQTKQWDTDSAFDNTTNYRFTCPSGEAGKYFFGASVELNMTSATGSTRCLIMKNDSVAIRSNQGGLSYYHNTAICGVIDLAVGDFVEVKVYQNSGGTLTTQIGEEDTFFFGYKLAE